MTDTSKKPARKRIAKPKPSTECVCVFEYMYRDASNYKAFGELLLIGNYTVDDFEAIHASCDDDRSFIAEQIGIPALCHILYEFGGGPTDDDHIFHAIIRFRNALPNEIGMAPWGTVAKLVAEFSRARGNWNYSLSPNWPGDPWTHWKAVPVFS